MKKISVFLLICFFINTLSAQKNIISGKVTDIKTGEKLVGASVFFLKENGTTNTTLTNAEGNYSIKIDSGNYKIQVSFIGYEKKIIDSIYFELGHLIPLDLQLTSAASFDRSFDILVSDERKEVYDTVITFDPETYEESIMVVRNDAISYSEPALLTYSGTSKLEERKVERKRISKHIVQEKAGQLTAGEWRDLDHWTFWNHLMNDPDFAKMQDYWKYYPNQRFSVLLNDQSERPMADLKVKLIDQNEAVVWEGRTDNTGKVELWGNFYGKSTGGFQLRIEYNNNVYTFQSTTFRQSQNVFKLPIDCNPRKQIDLAFVVDATGSMSDEINYLKAELQDVIGRVEEENETVKVRTGAVFYRDITDDYLTRISPFTLDVKVTDQFIQEQSADGGGDHPEAVHTALEKAVDEMKWSDEALSRMLFLVLDAPPHYDEQVLASLRASIKKAAAKGIKIIPVTASGIDKHTEFLMKFFAMGTNGTYVFLTNHSGIGGNHIEPTAESYNVEMLNDLMVRLILENTTYESCERINKKATKRRKTNFRKSKKKVRGLDFKINYYPNPTTDRLFIELEEAVDLLSIKSINGEEVKRLGVLEKGRMGIDVSDLAAGTYILQFQTRDILVAERLVIVE